MRFVIFGAGAVGSVIGGRIFQHRDIHGHDVMLVGRRPHCEAINAHGLRINDPAGSVVVHVPAVETIKDASLQANDVVILTMKTQDTDDALDSLAASAPPDVVVACAQNGVENERLALRRFANVYGICVLLPASFMEPGMVDASGAPHNAILDVGRCPSGRDATSDAIAAAFESSGLVGESHADVMAAKHTKLVLNLGNAVDALVSDPDNARGLLAQARDEAFACFTAAGIAWTSLEADSERRKGVMEMRPIGGRHRDGGSTWQSFARGASSVEVDWLNGEIVLLGRLHGIDTPVNRMLCDVTRAAVARHVEPRSMRAADLIARL
jgi:2-dehydropantoate 2-reductase